MNTHQNARLTVACRALLVQRIQAGRPKAQVAHELGVSVKTAQKWLRRYHQEGLSVLRPPLRCCAARSLRCVASV
jgi:transposase